MLTKDLSITFCGVKFPNPFCLSSSPVGNCYEMCAKAYDTGWGGVVFKTIGFLSLMKSHHALIIWLKKIPVLSASKIWSKLPSILWKKTWRRSVA